MKKTKDSLVISVDKYNMFSPSILFAYGVTKLYLGGFFKEPDADIATGKYLSFIPSCLHIYHLGRSIYDRFSFYSKCDKTSHFINHDFTKNDAHYILTGVDHNYGLSITEMISVTGLLSDILGYFSTKSGFSKIQSCASKIGLEAYDLKGKCDIAQNNLQTYSNYALVATITLAVLKIFTGSSSASLKINYDVFTIDDAVEFSHNELEVVNYTTEISTQ